MTTIDTDGRIWLDVHRPDGTVESVEIFTVQAPVDWSILDYDQGSEPQVDTRWDREHEDREARS
jgi:hypothetical protein